MIPADTYVRLDKLSEQRGGVLPTGYWLKGYLVEEPRLNAVLLVLRTERAKQADHEVEPVKLTGYYSSSPVKEIIEHEDGSITCRTMNSHWKVTPIQEGS